MLPSSLLPAVQGFSPGLAAFPSQSAEAKASSARYAFNRAGWGYLTTLNKGLPVAEVASFSDGVANASTGRLWFYMMDPPLEPNQGYAAAITVSEASYNATCGFAGTLVDPEDPRCAKITISGTMAKSEGDDIATGKAALFAKHPQMKSWPDGHGFVVHELKITDVSLSLTLALTLTLSLSLSLSLTLTLTLTRCLSYSSGASSRAAALAAST